MSDQNLSQTQRWVVNVAIVMALVVVVSVGVIWVSAIESSEITADEYRHVGLMITSTPELAETVADVTGTDQKIDRREYKQIKEMYGLLFLERSKRAVWDNITQDE